MTLLLTILAFALILALLLGTAKRVLEAIGNPPDGRRLPSTPLPPSTLLPRGNLSYPRLIGRRRHAAQGWARSPRALVPLALAGTAILLLLVPLGQDEKRNSAGHATTPPSGAALPGVGMPGVLPGNTAVKPLHLALVFDDTYTGKARERELQALGVWLQTNHNPRTRVTVIDRSRRRASRPLAAADLADVRLVRRAPSPARVVRRALRRHVNRLLVTIGNFVKPTLMKTATVRVHARRGARTPADLQLARGDHRIVRVDPRRRNALASTLARAIISISGMRERR
jgi:hypothetical protein